MNTNPNRNPNRTKCSICQSVHRTYKYKGKIPLCAKHMTQILRYGHIKSRTQQDKNKIICNGKTCLMELYNINGGIKNSTIFSQCHFERVSKIKWSLNNGYAVGVITRKKQILFHNYIKERKIGYQLDHIDGNKLNNTDDNLRYATRAENLRNRKTKGVYQTKYGNWFTNIYYNGKKIYLGTYKNYDEALLVRRNAEAKYFQEFAYKY